MMAPVFQPCCRMGSYRYRDTTPKPSPWALRAYCQITEYMVSKVEHALALPAHHLREVLYVPLLVDLPRLQLCHLGPCGSHGLRVQTAEGAVKHDTLTVLCVTQHHTNR